MTATGIGLIFLSMFLNMGREPSEEPGVITVASFLIGMLLTTAGVLTFCWRWLP